MLERSEFALKVFCGAVALLLVYRLGLAVVHINPLYHLSIPALPSLASSPGTNGAGSAPKPANGVNAGSNSAQHTVTNSAGTNSPDRKAIEQTARTSASGSNAAARLETKTGGSATNGLASKAQSTNTTAGATTNLLGGKLATGPQPPKPARMPPPGSPMPGGPKPGPELPPEIQARLDRVIDSEILAPVVRPLPMALLGIAGNHVFLRAPNGQTGLIKEGEEVGGVKLLRIGTNRVLVEEQGERKELIIFAGLGSESLLSTQKDSPK